MTPIGVLILVILPMFTIGTVWGEPICSPDDPRAEGWDYEQIRIENIQECKLIEHKNRINE